MKKLIHKLMACLLIFTVTSCLYAGLEDLENSSAKEMTSVEYSYRFLYNDTIRKGTVNEEIQYDRVCEVIFNKNVEIIEENNIKGFRTTLTYDANSIQKAGPSGSVTREMLYDTFVKQIGESGLTRIWVYVNISDAATVAPLNGAPKLGQPGDYTDDCLYRVTAADGSKQDYLLKTVKGWPLPNPLQKRGS